jgi:flavin-binding protein dodecin
MYNVQNAASYKIEDVSFFPVGINDDVEIVGAGLYESRFDANKKTFSITYKKVIDGKESTLKVDENEPMMDQTKPAAEHDDKCNKQLSRMLQILHCFYAPEQINITGTSFNSVFQSIADYINRADKTIKVRLKTVYNDRGYVTTPRASKFQFIEKMDVEKSKIRIIAGIDLVVRPEIKADAEKPAGTTAEIPF